MVAMTKETQEKINQLQMAEQNLQSYLQQKQSYQSQQLEIDSALKELDKTDQAYKIVGNIMIKNSKEDLKKGLESKKELVSMRLKNVEKQEAALREKTKQIQEEFLKEMQTKKE